MKKVFFVSLFLCLSACLFAQQKVRSEIAPKNISASGSKNSYLTFIDWKPTSVISMPNGEKYTYLNFSNASFETNPFRLPAVVVSQNLKDNETDVEISLLNTKYETLNQADIADVKGLEQLPGTIVINKNIGYHRGQAVLLANFIPLRRLDNGSVEKLVAYELKIITRKSTLTKSRSLGRTYASSSVLSSGDWYKIGLTRDGVYKLDYTFFKNTGIDIKLVNPHTIRLFGNGGGMLPYSNSASRTDDLAENAIYVSGANDGRFDSTDYVLFYGKGPNKWTKDPGSCLGYSSQTHIYCDTAYYFINVNDGIGKRISTQASLTETPTFTVTEFDDFQFHELDNTNLIKSGREFYGEFYDVTTNYQFDYIFPNLVTSTPVFLKTSVVARCVGCPSSFTVSASSTDLNQTIPIAAASSIYYADYVLPGNYCGSFNASSNTIPLSVKYNKINDGIGYLNYIELKARRELKMSGLQMPFKDLLSAQPGAIAEYQIGDINSSYTVWDVTDLNNVKNQEGTLNGNQFSFITATDSIHDFIIFFNTDGFLTPTFCEKIQNQNLHALSAADMIIVTPPLFLQQANLLADLHREKDSLSISVVTTKQIYNEFSSGSVDVTAIKDFVKMIYDRSLSGTTPLKYLLLFGDGSYDNKSVTPSNTNFIPTYESSNSTSPTVSYVSEDYFGLLDDTEADNVADVIDIGIGRLPVKNAKEADDIVAKIKRYLYPSSYFDLQPNLPSSQAQSSLLNPGLGDWRNVVCFVADDQDQGTHQSQAENIAKLVDTTYQIVNIDKIYLDAYKQVVAAGGQSYPDVYDAINRRLDKGALIMNYTGHGGETGWTGEAVLNIPMVQNWKNNDRLPLFVTATCEFSRFDDPARTSAGELVLLNSEGGGIGLLTTTRLVYSTPNYFLNINFYKHVFDTIDGNLGRLGDVVRLTKATSTPSVNNRNFTLLGDPAIRLAYPKDKVITTSINSHPVESVTDTIKALSRVTIKGYVANANGSKKTSFNGVIYPSVFDKAATIMSLGNDKYNTDDPMPSLPFVLQKNILYKGKVSVVNGDFEFSFVVPKDISYNFGQGRVSYYAEDGKSDANGYEERLIIGGFDTNAPTDNSGPEVKLYMNDEKFISGGLTNQTPSIYAVLYDLNGINTIGNGIGHDITAVIDDNTEKTLALNDYYQAELNSYQKGTVRYKLKDMAVGSHTVKFKAWDVYNNSSESQTEFIVAESAALALNHVLNYPNPFTSHTSFYFEHNKPSSFLQINIQIFTVSGKLIKNIEKTMFSNGYRSDGIDWDGKDDFGDKIGRGVYVYKIKVRSTDGTFAEKFEKLVLLQ